VEGNLCEEALVFQEGDCAEISLGTGVYLAQISLTSNNGKAIPDYVITHNRHSNLLNVSYKDISNINSNNGEDNESVISGHVTGNGSGENSTRTGNGIGVDNSEMSSGGNSDSNNNSNTNESDINYDSFKDENGDEASGNGSDSDNEDDEKVDLDNIFFTMEESVSIENIASKGFISLPEAKLLVFKRRSN
jgi:hypothetical protein